MVRQQIDIQLLNQNLRFFFASDFLLASNSCAICFRRKSARSSGSMSGDGSFGLTGEIDRFIATNLYTYISIMAWVGRQERTAGGRGGERVPKEMSRPALVGERPPVVGTGVDSPSMLVLLIPPIRPIGRLPPIVPRRGFVGGGRADSGSLAVSSPGSFIVKSIQGCGGGA